MLDMSEAEERAARCNLCGIELNLIENLAYGNRCVFCGDGFLKVGLGEFLTLCYLDYKIYNLMGKMLVREYPTEARMLFLGCVAEAGAADVRGIRTAQEKRGLIKILRRYVRNEI